MVTANDAEGDIAELRKLLELATRPGVKDLLRRELNILVEGRSSEPMKEARDIEDRAQTDTGTHDPQETQNTGSGAGTGPQVTPAGPVLLQSGKAPMQRNYNPVSSFSWDQDSDKVKIYFFLEGASKEGVELDVRPQSVDVRMHDVGSAGRHLRFGVPKLGGLVDPERCTVMVKPNRVTVTLRKKDRGQWMDLKEKEDKMKPKLGDTKDPMAGIMDLMKNMYDEGDEDMKRTIAKAWSDAQSGKAKDPLMPGF